MQKEVKIERSLRQDVFLKKGTGHIEMLLGFTFFVGTVLFLFVVINIGLSESSDNMFLLEKLESQFKEEVGTQVISFFVKLGAPLVGCIQIDLLEYDLNSSLSSKLKFEDQNVSSGFDGSVLNVEAGYQEFYVYLSDGFANESLSGCSSAVGATIGPLKNDIYYSIEKIENLKSEYYAGYETAQSRMGIGGIYDFAIEFEDGSLSMNKTISQNVDIYTMPFSIMTVDEDGVIESKDGVFKIW